MRSFKLFSETFTKREHGYQNKAFKCRVDSVENKTTAVLRETIQIDCTVFSKEATNNEKSN